jgi:hypothetical protein
MVLSAALALVGVVLSVEDSFALATATLVDALALVVVAFPLAPALSIFPFLASRSWRLIFGRLKTFLASRVRRESPAWGMHLLLQWKSVRSRGEGGAACWEFGDLDSYEDITGPGED